MLMDVLFLVASMLLTEPHEDNGLVEIIDLTLFHALNDWTQFRIIMDAEICHPRVQ